MPTIIDSLTSVKFAPCDRPGRCPRRDAANPPADRKGLCWGCQDWWRFDDLRIERERQKFADRERLAPLLADLTRLTEVFPVEMSQAIWPVLMPQWVRMGKALISFSRQQTSKVREQLRGEIEDLAAEAAAAIQEDECV